MLRVSFLLTWTTMLYLLDLPAVLEGFNILGICPSTSYSHQQPFRALMKALVHNGHRVTAISPLPLKEPIENYTDVDLSFTYRKEDCTKLRHLNPYVLLKKNMDDGNALCEQQLLSSEIQKLIARNETFDAIIIEALWYQCYYSLAKIYNYPVMINFLSVGNLPYPMDSVGNPDDPFFNPDMAFAFTDRMALHEKIFNFYYTWWTRIYYRHFHLPRATEIAQRLLPGVSCSEIDRNFSLVILGNNHVFGYPKPLLPNVIEVHSLQITDHPRYLPNDIQEFLDGATEGAIYFSLGSNLQSHQLPAGALKALFDAFGSLKQRVLWKDSAEINAPPDIAAAIKFVKWAPQQAILAHPRVKIYMMQGGLQSLQEAVYYEVPLIAIPFFGDQNFNARKILSAQIGLTLHVDTMTNESVFQAVNDLLTDERYSRNIRRLAAIVKDDPVPPIKKAVWAVEHVLKFPDAPHLQYSGRDVSLLQYYQTVLFILAFSIIIVSVALAIILRLCDFINKRIRLLFLLLGENRIDKK